MKVGGDGNEQKWEGKMGETYVMVQIGDSAHYQEWHYLSAYITTIWKGDIR